jgi:hypothetical protein
LIGVYGVKAAYSEQAARQADMYDYEEVFRETPFTHLRRIAGQLPSSSPITVNTLLALS